MGALDAFYSTWSRARETFGQGTPQDGATLDQSSKLTQMKAGVEAATPDARWQGPASDAYATKNKEHAGAYGKLADLDQRMAAQVTNAANVVTTGRQNLDSIKSWVSSAAEAIPTGISASDRDRKLMSIASQGIGKVSDVITASHTAMSTIGANVGTIKGEWESIGDTPGKPKDAPHVQMLGNEKKDGEGQGDKEDKPGDEDSGTSKPPESVHDRAVQDAHDVNGGNLSQERRQEIAEHLAAAGLTPQQVDDNLAGKKVQLTGPQSDYLNTFLGRIDPTKAMDYSEQLGKDGNTAGQQALADGMFTISNPNVALDQSVGGGTGDPSRIAVGASFTQRDSLLHPEVQDSFRSQPHTDAHNAVQYTGIDRPYFDRLSDMLGHASDNAMQGSNLSRDMTVRAADMLNSYNSSDDTVQSALGSRSDLDKTLDKMLAVSTRDHVGDARILSGDLGGGADSTNRDSVVMALVDEKGLPAAAGLVNWIDDDAIPNSGAPGPGGMDGEHYRATLAGNAAQGLAEVATTLHSGWDGADNANALMKNANPEFTRAMAEALSPYQAAMAGYEGGPTDGYGFHGLGDEAATRRLFAVIDSDDTAAQSWNQHAQIAADTLERQYGQSIGQHPELPDTNSGHAAGELRGLMQAGLGEEASHRFHVSEGTAQEQAQRLAAAQQHTKDMLNYATKYGGAAIDLLPGGGLINKGIGLGQPLLEQVLLSETYHAPYVDPASEKIVIDDRSLNRAQDYNIISGMHSGGADLPSTFDGLRDSQGNFKPLSVIEADPHLRDLLESATQGYFSKHGDPLRLVDEATQAVINHSTVHIDPTTTKPGG
ncbi:TPR repeat region-containing protein [Mycolicibacterium lutetiense]